MFEIDPPAALSAFGGLRSISLRVDLARVH